MNCILSIWHKTDHEFSLLRNWFSTVRWKVNTRRKLGRYIKKNKHKRNLNKLQTSGQPTGLFLTVHHMAYTKYPQIDKETRHLSNKQSGISSLWIRSFAGNHEWFPSIIILTNHLARERIEIVICVTPQQTTIDAPKCLDRHVTSIQPIRLFFFCWYVGAELPLCAMVVRRITWCESASSLDAV